MGTYVGNVLDYGADPTGVADSTTAIQNCINANNYAFFPAGTFKHKTIVVSTNGCVIEGVGAATFISADAGTVGRLYELRDVASGVTIRNMRFDGQNLPAGGSVDCIADVVTDTNNIRYRARFKELYIQNFTGSALNLTARGMAYELEDIDTWNVGGYGINLQNVSDSAMKGGHVAGSKKNGIRLTDGNWKFNGTKVCMSGTDMTTQYAGLLIDGGWYNMFNGCEFQQNCYDAVQLTNTAVGNVFEGCVWDSNNRIDADLISPNVFAQINVKNSPFNRFSGVLIDGRFISRDGVPYNIEVMHGVMIDDKSPYCKFDFTYSPTQYNLVNPQSGPTVLYPRFLSLFNTAINDHTTKYQVNNSDYLDFAPTDVVIGTNATISATHPTNMNLVSASGGKEVDMVMTAGQAVTTANFFSQKINLNMANFPQAVGKTKMYISYESKNKKDIAVLIYPEETSTPNPSANSAGYVRPINVNHNTSWMPAAGYLPLTKSNEAGFQINLSVGINVDVNQTLSASDIISFIRNIKVSFA